RVSYLALDDEGQIVDDLVVVHQHYFLARDFPGSMIPAKQLLSEIVTSLREVIAPAIAEPYPKAQAYMAAVILEFVARQVEERSDIEADKHAALLELTRDLSRFPEVSCLVSVDNLNEAGL